MKTETNDQKIMELKKQIEEKKKKISKSLKFTPVTNCSIEIDNVRMNIQVLNKEQLITLLVKLNSYKISATELGLIDEYFVSGYSLNDWIKDLQAKLMNVSRKVEEDRLKKLEDKLHNLLSNEKKIELEIDEIMSSLE